MYKKLVIFFILIIPKLVLAQSPASQVARAKILTELDVHFIYEVKQVDEFIDRFNNDSTQLQEFMQRVNAPKLSRESMIKTLFNYSRQGGWNSSDIVAFIKQVDNKQAPILLNFLEG